MFALNIKWDLVLVNLDIPHWNIKCHGMKMSK